ncbi:MAG: YeeE/YedE family protein [Nitrosomonadales bacterium]|nr:YeeE/YedE family protein [Nitrosomonadales bacterium]
MSSWPNFTPWTSLAGGLLIGLAVSILVLFNGRIAGISGIVGGLLRPVRTELEWRIAFIAGLVVAPLVYGVVSELPPVEVNASNWQLVLAGLLVGIGTRYASGCTSGHGICGVARLSRRSMLATASFMLSGMVTVYLIRHIWSA